MTRACANCGKSIETDCTEEQCQNYYCSAVCADKIFTEVMAMKISLDKKLENEQ